MQPHHRVKIAYADYMGETTERFFEPHTLVFCNNSWYEKSRSYDRHNLKLVAGAGIEPTTSRL